MDENMITNCERKRSRQKLKYSPNVILN